MNRLLSTINTAALAIIAASPDLITWRQMQPAFVETSKGIYSDTHSGTLFRKQGEQLMPVNESAEEGLRRKHPDGRSKQTGRKR